MEEKPLGGGRLDPLGNRRDNTAQIRERELFQIALDKLCGEALCMGSVQIRFFFFWNSNSGDNNSTNSDFIQEETKTARDSKHPKQNI